MEEAAWLRAEDITLEQLEPWALTRLQGEYWEEAADVVIQMVHEEFENLWPGQWVQAAKAC